MSSIDGAHFSFNKMNFIISMNTYIMWFWFFSFLPSLHFGIPFARWISNRMLPVGDAREFIYFAPSNYLFLTLLALFQMKVIPAYIRNKLANIEMAFVGWEKNNKIILHYCNTMRCETGECDHCAFRYTTPLICSPAHSRLRLYKMPMRPTLLIQSSNTIASKNFQSIQKKWQPIPTSWN